MVCSLFASLSGFLQSYDVNNYKILYVLCVYIKSAPNSVHLCRLWAASLAGDHLQPAMIGSGLLPPSIPSYHPVLNPLRLKESQIPA